MSSLLIMTFTPSTTAVAGNVFLTAIVGLLPAASSSSSHGIVFKVATHWCSIISLVAIPADRGLRVPDAAPA